MCPEPVGVNTEPRTLADQITTARTLLDGTSFTAGLPILNCSAKDYHKQKNTLLGTAEKALEVAGRNETEETTTLVSPEDEADEENTNTEHINCVMERLPESLNEEQKQMARSFIRKHAELFSRSEFDIGRTSMVPYTIDTGDNRPVRQQLRRHPTAHLQFIDEQVEKMLQTGVIEKANSPWCSNVTLVMKRDKSLRFCIDFRAVNALTKVDSYPIPRIDSCLNTLGKAKYFSTADLRSGYWQLELDESTRDKTAFVTRRGTLSFGLCNGTAAFQRLMDCVLSGLTWSTCLCYLDDVVIFSDTFENHLQRLQELFQRFRDANLKLHPGKCFLFQQEVDFLGFVISGEGIEPQPDKIKAVTEWPRPTTLTQVWGFVALASYYRRLIPAFSQLARPLFDLTKKNRTFEWGEQQEEAFQILKTKLATSLVVGIPQDDGDFVLDTDASQTALGAVLHQWQDGVLRVLGYASRVLQKAETSYCTTRLELAAVVYGLKYFRQFLLGRTFELRTDHAALRALMKTPEPLGQQARHLDLIAEYSFNITHRSGVQHANADALSRNHVYARKM